MKFTVLLFTLLPHFWASQGQAVDENGVSLAEKLEAMERLLIPGVNSPGGKFEEGSMYSITINFLSQIGSFYIRYSLASHLSMANSHRMTLPFKREYTNLILYQLSLPLRRVGSFKPGIH